jgi:hypothetical protein
MKANLRQLDALAALVVSIRTDWGKQRTFDMLRKAATDINDDLQDITVAALKCALTPRNQTPDLLGMTGPHWQRDEPNQPPKRPADKTCPRCGMWPESHHDDGSCPRRTDRIHAYAEQARQAAAGARKRTQEAKP